MSEIPAALWAGFRHGGEMGRRIGGYDWRRTPLGPFARWPLSLRSLIGACLESSIPSIIAWGPERVCLYNDAMAGVLGTLHPAMLGKSVDLVLGEQWSQEMAWLYGSIITRASSSTTTVRADRIDPQHREHHVNISYSPLRNDKGDIEGAVASVIDVTRDVVTQRRRQMLDDLRAAGAASRSVGQLCRGAAPILADGTDVAFAVLYASPGTGHALRAAGSAGKLPDGGAGPTVPAQLRAWRRGSDPVHLAGFDEPIRVHALPLLSGSSGKPTVQLVLGVRVRGVFDPDFYPLDAIRECLVAALSAHAAAPAEPGKAWAEEPGRAEVAQDIHDTLISPLYGISLMAQKLIGTSGDAGEERLASAIADTAAQALRDARALAADLHPENLGRKSLTDGLSDLMRQLQSQGITRREIDLIPEPDAPATTKEAAYRITQEALSNIVRHAKATQVRLRLTDRAGILQLEVRDDGIGFEAKNAADTGLGLRSMRARAGRAGGMLTVISEPGAGTSVRARLPLSPPADQPS